MPKTPNVSFKVENNNLAVTTPQVGVSLVLARTSKGPYDDPSTIVRSISQFRNLFGGEVYENNREKLSDIERALANGSNLRIIRVRNSGYISGYISTESSEYDTVASSEPGSYNTIITFVSDIGSGGSSVNLFGFGLKVKDDDYTGLTVKIVLKNRSYYLDIYDRDEVLIDELPIITLSLDGEDANIADVNQLVNFIENNKYFTPVFNTGDVSSITTLRDALDYLRNYDGTDPQDVPSIQIDDVNTVSYQVNSNPGSAPTKAEWIASAEAIRDVSDVYQVACSHINDNLVSSDVNEVHAAIATMAKECEDWVYYIEVPFYNQLGRPNTDTELVTLANTIIGLTGASRYVALFTGGLKFYGNDGNLINNNVIGDVLGLGDSAAQSVGPWYSFSGINRGIVWDANGPVIANYGSPSRKSSMENLAEYCLNVFCNKETPGSGMQTVLWHGFTTQVKQDSFRFLSVVRLVLYIKKNLRPIFEAAIEEPNTFGTWSDIYLKGKKKMDYLVTRQAITEYEWMGDQNASSYEDLQVNNEADVRQGKYRVVIRLREVVPMQDIEIALSIDKASNSTSVTVNS